MSVEALSLVLHHSRAKGTDKLVLLGIANHAGDGGAWPAVATLARYANVTERNVQKAVERLVGMGELARHVQAGGLAHHNSYTRPNRYDVLVGCPAWCDRTAQHRPLAGWDKLPAGGYAQRLTALPGLSDLSESDPVSQTTPGVDSDGGPDVEDDTRTVPRTHPVEPVSAQRDSKARERVDVAARAAEARELIRQAANR